jgi:DNA-binding MarR family transcriptional regulator
VQPLAQTPETTRSQQDVPASLSAVESYVLRYAPVATPGPEALRIALRELVLRGALRLVRVRAPRPLGLGHRTRWLLARGPAARTCREPALRALLDLHAAHPHRRLELLGARAAGASCGGILVDEFLRAARRHFGGDRGYVEGQVVPGLVARGLLELRRGGAGRRVRYAYTPAGREADDRLEHRLTAARRAGEGRSAAAGPARVPLPPDLRPAALILDLQQPELGLLARLRDPQLSPAELAALDTALGRNLWDSMWFGGGGGGDWGGGGDGGGG